jgi:clan AA aspartic protease (TIGR02281 family)
MRTLVFLLSIALMASVGLNIFLFLPTLESPVQDTELNQAIEINRSTLKQPIQRTPLWQIDANKAFEQGHFAQAISQISHIPDADKHKYELLNSWYNQADEWLKEQKYFLFTDFEQVMLKHNSNDINVLVLSAKKELATESVNSGLISLYDILERPLTNLESDQVKKIINQTVAQSINNLKEVQAWQVLQTLTETLLIYEPTNIDYIFQLAESYAYQQDGYLTEYAITLLPFSALTDPRVEQIRNLIVKTPSPPQQNIDPDDETLTSAVNLKQTGEHYIVEAEINQQIFVDLLIDTGASTTTLSRSTFNGFFNSNDVTFLGQYRFNTANGQTQAPVYRVKQIAIGDYVLDDLAVVVLPLEHMNDADGLLGMNFLRAFQFQIDQSKAQLLLTPREN